MAPSPLQQRRTHNTLLLQKLLNLRDSASPFTLILDTLEQRGGPVVREFARRAKISKNNKIIFISFAALKGKVPFEIDFFIKARGKPLGVLRTEILSHLPAPTTAQDASSNPTKYLVIIDTLNPLSSAHPQHLPPFLSSLLVSPQISLLATYHTDIPLTCSPPASISASSYLPSPLTTLIYLATAILTISSLPQTLARKRARDKSHQEPVFGIQEGREGVIVGLKERVQDEQGLVVNMEIRRRSGRGVIENFVLLPPASAGWNAKSTVITTTNSTRFSTLSEFILLHDHPLYSSPSTSSTSAGGAANPDDQGMNTTFNLGLTEKQKRDRENVVLPYFDAQKDGGAAGPGDGGRILYDMGEEDREDFDDEEDEI